MDSVAAPIQVPWSRSRPPGSATELAVPLGSLVLRTPVFVGRDDTVAAAARAMRGAKASSALVRGERPGAAVGILTSGDLRDRVVAEDLPPDTPVSAVMSPAVSSLPDHAPLFAAMVLMLDEGFEHVPVQREGQIVGVLTQKDMLRHQAHSPMVLLSRIRSLQRIEDLADYPERIAATAGALLTDGLRAVRVTRVVAALNDALCSRLIDLAAERLGPPPCRYAWLALGSQGRMEQSLLTDQDHAVVYADDAPGAAEYFSAMAHSVADGLQRAGFAPCPGGYMATNWCLPLREFTRVFRRWVYEPEPQALVETAVFLDFRTTHGDLSVQVLHDVLLGARDSLRFLTALTSTAGSFTPPLGAFGRVRTDGGRLDLKRAGLAAIVILARIHALQAGSTARPTLDRLEEAVRHDVIGRRTARELADSYDFLLQLRLRQQLYQVLAGQEVNNEITHDDLTRLEKHRLRESLRTVARLQRLTAARLRGD